MHSLQQTDTRTSVRVSVEWAIVRHPHVFLMDEPLSNLDAKVWVEARVAAFAAGAGLQVGRIRHSGKHRAEETGSILAEHLSPAEGVLAIPERPPRTMSVRWQKPCPPPSAPRPALSKVEGLGR